MNRSTTLILSVLLLAAGCSKNNDTGTKPVMNENASSVSTFAGSGTAGSANGTKTFASFDLPTGVAMSTAGFVFVADAQNNQVRIISPQGVVNTIAGTGKVGFSNTVDSVTFSAPTGVAVDANGNVYVADQGNSAIRMINTSGVTSTLAGSGTAGFNNATGAAAMFSNPTGVAVDAAGNVYVADAGNNVIRKIAATTAVVTTFAGTGTRGSNNGAATVATFNQPGALAVDGSGNVYVADTYNNKIRKITPQGVVSTLAGSGSQGAANGAGAAASFNQPAGIALDASGNVYVGDTNNNVIREISTTGTVTTLAGTGAVGAANGVLTASSFNSPQGVVVDAYDRVFVADALNNLIRLVSQ